MLFNSFNTKYRNVLQFSMLGISLGVLVLLLYVRHNTPTDDETSVSATSKFPTEQVDSVVPEVVTSSTIENSIPITNKEQDLAAVTTAMSYAISNPTRTNYENVINLSRGIITKWPESEASLIARRLLIDALDRIWQTESARTAFVEYTEALGRIRKNDDVAITALSNEAKNYVQRGNPHHSVFFFQRIISRYPCTRGEIQARISLGNVLFSLGRPSEGIAQFAEVIATGDRQEKLDAYRLLAENYVSVDLEKAKATWEQIAIEYPDQQVQGQVAFNVAQYYYLKGRKSHPESRRRYEEMIKAFPNHNLTTNALQMIATIDGIKSGTIEHWEKEAVNPTRPAYSVQEGK